MGTEDARELVRRFVVEAFERFNVAALSELLAPDFRTDAFETFAVDQGPAGLRHTIGMLAKAFSNARLNIDDVIAEGDRVVMRYRWSADHTGPLMGLAPSGTRISVPGILIARVADGRIAQYWREEDTLSLLRQLGALPTSGPPE